MKRIGKPLAAETKVPQDSHSPGDLTTRHVLSDKSNSQQPSPSGQSAASDERYRPLFALSPQPAWVYEVETLRFLEVNEAAVRSYGWSRDEFLQLTLRDIRPPTELDRLSGLVADTPASERHTAAAVHRTRAGQLRHVEISSYPLEFDGRDARMVLVQDVTERVEAQAALERSEQMYRSVVEQIQDVFFRTDREGNWTFLNLAWKELTGHPAEENLHTSYLTHVHPSDRQILVDAFRPLLDGAADSMLVEVRYFRRSGGYRWVEASTRSVRDPEGRPAGTMGTLRDVTERRAADQERHRLATNVRQLLDASGEGVYGLDARGVVTFINRRGSELLGYEPEELVGQSMHERTHYSRTDGRPYPIDECPIRRAAMEGAACAVDDEVMWRKDGVPIQVEYSASPVIENGQVSGAVINFRDITSRKRAELELIVARDAAQAASRAKSDFLARMSHELRTPLNSIIGFANVLLKNKQGTMGTGELSYLTRIATNGRHLLGLINDILDLSKIEAGRMTLELSSVRLQALVRETIEELESQTRESDVVLRTVIPDHVLPMDADEARLRQVLINLIGNALKFTEVGEVVVRLDVDAQGAPLRIQVRDTGIGIPADRLDAIFNVFEQAESMINRRFGGTGLGLAISRSLCELMGHRLEVDSVEGKGTTMTVRFSDVAQTMAPRTPATSMPVLARRAEAPLERMPHTVLVVDDDQEARTILGQILDEVNCRIVTASTGVEALRLARELLPSLIFLDLRLPKISGFDVLRILQADEALRTTPVIIASVVGTESRSALGGAAAILDKPLDRAEVLATVRRWLSD